MLLHLSLMCLSHFAKHLPVNVKCPSSSAIAQSWIKGVRHFCSNFYRVCITGYIYFVNTFNVHLIWSTYHIAGLCSLRLQALVHLFSFFGSLLEPPFILGQHLHSSTIDHVLGGGSLSPLQWLWHGVGIVIYFINGSHTAMLLELTSTFTVHICLGPPRG